MAAAGQALMQGAPLRITELHGLARGLVNPGKPAPAVQATLGQPQAQAIVNNQLDAVAAFVGEGVGAVWAGTTKPVDDPGEQAIKTQAHVNWGVAQVEALKLGGEDACLGCGCGWRNWRICCGAGR